MVTTKKAPPALINTFANGRPVFIKDAGNNNVKTASDSAEQYDHAPEFVEVFDHAIAEISEAEYNDLCEIYEDKPAFHFFRWRNTFFVVGEEAYNYKPNFDPERGRAKYQRAVYGILAVGGLLRYTRGNIPEELNLLCAFPPDDKPQTDVLMSSVAGKWKIERCGVIIEFEVLKDTISVYPEVMGSVFNVTQSIDGLPVDRKKYEPLFQGKTLVCDLGGGSFDMALLNDGIMDMNYIPRSWRTGMNFAINRFKRDFDQKHAALVSLEEDGLRRNIIRDLFIDPAHQMKLRAGKTLDCSSLYKAAVSGVISDIRKAIREYVGNLNGIDYVLLTGGGSTLLLHDFQTSIFADFHDAKRLFLATNKPQDMLKANALGGVKIAHKMKQRALEDVRKKG